MSSINIIHVISFQSQKIGSFDGGIEMNEDMSRFGVSTVNSNLLS